MKEKLIINTDACYRQAEQKAVHYFKALNLQVKQKTYVSTLTKDIQLWKHNHIHHYSILSLFSRRKNKLESKGYHQYIQWLNYTGKLEHYLDRSISYLFMRDLGKALDSPETQIRIRRVVDDLKNKLTQSNTPGQENRHEFFSMAGLYRMAQKEGIESAMIWVLDKLKTVSSQIPEGMSAEHAQRKLIKIIAGVLMHVMEELGTELSTEERKGKLDAAIRLGYSYGLTYPFIDDLLDANILSKLEKKKYSDLIRTTLITGAVPELGEWP
jgi:hypothetical protein